MRLLIDHQFIHSPVPHFEGTILTTGYDKVVFVKIETSNRVINAGVQPFNNFVLVV